MIVQWTPAARRDLERCDRQTQHRILDVVERFATTGHGDVVRLKGVIRQWRLRVGDWRVRFTLDAALTTLTILTVRHRSEAYRH